MHGPNWMARIVPSEIPWEEFDDLEGWYTGHDNSGRFAILEDLLTMDIQNGFNRRHMKCAARCRIRDCITGKMFSMNGHSLDDAAETDSGFCEWNTQNEHGECIGSELPFKYNPDSSLDCHTFTFSSFFTQGLDSLANASNADGVCRVVHLYLQGSESVHGMGLMNGGTFVSIQKAQCSIFPKSFGLF